MDVDEIRLQHALTDQLTVQEALDIIFAQDGDEGPISDTLYIAPPDPAVQSDEDSGDEDGGGVPDNLTARQLTADAEIRYHDARDDADEDQIEESLSASTSSNKFTFQGISYKTPRTWYTGEMESNLLPFPQFDYKKYQDLSLVELFELFLDEDIIQLFVTESNRYAIFKDCENPLISAEEIKTFISILILSGYNSVSNRRMYWESIGDARNELIVNSMRRNRFELILRFLHCADNSKLDPKNKMWKLQPLIDKVKINCKKHFIPQQNLSYDESMVKYYGKHGCKQFIRGKPIQFGFKIWCLCTIDGYLVDFEVYQGKSVTRHEQFEKLFGKATDPLIDMIQTFPTEIQKLPYHFFVDNLFTSFNLLAYLREKGYGGTGTIKNNRLTKSCPLHQNKALDGNERGTYKSYISKEDGVNLVKWKDNATVTVASNCLGSEPLGTARRYSQSEKKYVHVPRPHLIGEYNRYMGGVDRLDENVAMHRINIRNKKWYWAILSWLIDVSIHNAWRLARQSGRKITQLEFRREIVQVYLKRYGTASKGPGRPSMSLAGSSRVSDAIRFDGLCHWIKKIEKKRRCAGEGCKNKTSAVRTQCKKCDIGLCIDCFEGFHTKK